MLSFTKFLWMKPSLALSLKILNVDSVDWLNTDTDATENIEKFLAEENNLEENNRRARLVLKEIILLVTDGK